MPTNIRDPRSIVTPEAFELRPELLGTPLARPWRRFWAMMVDLLAIGILTVLLDSIPLLVWGALALLFLWIASQDRERASQAVTVLVRVFVGCLGVAILTVVVVAGLVVYNLNDTGIRERVLTEVGEMTSGARIGATAAELAREDDPDDVVDEAVDLLEELEEAGAVPPEPLELLRDLTPADAPWGPSADSLYQVAIAQWAGDMEEGRGEGEGDTTGAEAEQGAGDAEPGSEAGPIGSEDIATLSDIQAVEAWLQLSALRDSADLTAAQQARLEALRSRFLDRLAGDTLQALRERVDELGDRREDALEDVEALERELEERQSGVAALLRDLWEQAGSAIGLWSIYFTVFLTLWKGRTPGKRLLGVRVLRLDGEPLTWWSSFERGGGYVAGLATGLLGFAQVFWDPNRQCIHDKIVGTVVVREGAAPVPGAWREAAGPPVTKEDTSR